MMKLRDRIVYRENRISALLDRLAHSGRPTGLIGCGIYAGILCDALPRYGIEPGFIVLDEKYLSDENRTFRGLPVITPAECSLRFPDACVIIAYNYRYEDEWKVIRSETEKLTPDNEVIALGAVFLNEFDFIPYEYVLGNIKGFEKTYEMLEDPLSRRIMAEFLNARISGDASRLSMFNTDSKNDYELDLIFEHEKAGSIVECGAFDGKSALQINSYCKGRHRIYALEPEKSNYNKLCENTKGLSSVIPIMKGTADKEYTAFISGSDGTASISGDSGGSAEDAVGLTTIDSLMGDEKVFAIFMDIEGSELPALKGAREVILRDRPVLAVRVYHRRDDLLLIPQFIASLPCDEKYRYYLRVNNTGIGTYDVTFYAI